MVLILTLLQLHGVQRFSRTAIENARKNASQRELMQLYKFLHCRAQLLQSVNQQPEDTGANLESEQASTSSMNETESESKGYKQQDISEQGHTA